MDMNVFRKVFLSVAIAFVAAGSFAQTFTIKGTIPGIKDGTKVQLRVKESGKQIEAECLSKGSSFVLTGKVESPMLVQLQIDDKPKAAYKDGEYAEDRGGNFMLEAGDYTVSAACYDSIPRNYDLYNSIRFQEKNLRIEGGKAQRQYQEWASATYDARLKADVLQRQLRNAMFPEKGKKEVDSVLVARLQSLTDAADMKEEQANESFIAAHSDYAISLLLMEKQMERPFAFSIAEYDKMLATFANNYDKTRYAEFVNTVAEMKKFVKGDHYKGLVLEAKDGKTVNLKDIVVPGKYNFIDFWASWCGPCRAAIPSVKKLHRKMGDKLNVVSISVDRQRKDWERAVDEEKMSWGQYLVPQTSMKALKDGYYIRYVPSLVVIDPEGKIQLFTSDPQKAHAYLEQNIR